MTSSLQARVGRPAKRIVFLLGLMLMLMASVFSVYAQSGGAEAIDMAVSYGYDNSAKGGRYLPVTVDYSNPKEQEFSGMLQVTVPESDGNLYRYEYPVTLSARENRAEVYHIPIGIRADRLTLCLVDENGTETAFSEVKLNVSLDVSELFIGILSDTPEQLSYLNGIGINYSMLRTRTFALDEAQIPDNEIGLNQLDVILVTNYRLRNLSEAQSAAVMDWVHNGGVLILGTGERVDDTLGRYAPELLDDSYGRPELWDVDMGEEYALQNPGDASVELMCVEIPMHGGNILFSSDGLPVLTVAAKEKGLIAAAAYDYVDIEDFCRRHPEYLDKMFTTLLGEDRIYELAEMVYSGNSGTFWSVQSLINTGDVDKLPNLAAYVAVICIYLLLIGPGIYLFLRDRGLQLLYRRCVILCSVCFAAVIYLLGTGTRFRDSFFTYATIRDVTEDYVTDTTYINVRNPYNGEYSVALSPEYSVFPITRSNIYSAESRMEEPPQMIISQMEEETRLTAQEVVSFSPRYFQLDKKVDNTENIGLVGEVILSDGEAGGYIKNQFPYPLEHVTVLMYGRMVLLGRMEAGETRAIDGAGMVRYPLSSPYLAASYITGFNRYSQADIGDAGYLAGMERTNLLLFYMENYLSGYRSDGRVIAFSTEQEENQFLREKNPETYGLTMLTSAVNVYAEEDSVLYRSALMKAPRVISGSYTAETNSIIGADPVTLEYSFGNDIEIQKLVFEPVSEELEQSGQNSFVQNFRGKLYLYNYESGNFDLMNAEQMEFTAEQLRMYLSPVNTMTVRFVQEESDAYQTVQLPMPMVTGRER